MVRVSVLDSLLRVKKSFFSKLGLSPGTDPQKVVATIENSSKHERSRGYGYLFGYPDYAVNFFISADLIEEKTNEIEPRDFFAIPVYTGKEGHFTYAYPKGHRPTADIDSVIYYRSEKILDNYRKIRKDYTNPDGTIKARQLLIEYRDAK
ncbi:MAG: hypothetical protein LBV43_12410 [Prevotella sp.]|nr:hypothetical protein [Prevotella sp.]